jgi:hypothetical protein
MLLAGIKKVSCTYYASVTVVFNNVTHASGEGCAVRQFVNKHRHSDTVTTVQMESEAGEARGASTLRCSVSCVCICFLPVLQTAGANCLIKGHAQVFPVPVLVSR